jgi:hypothetical protein
VWGWSSLNLHNCPSQSLEVKSVLMPSNQSQFSTPTLFPSTSHGKKVEIIHRIHIIHIITSHTTHTPEQILSNNTERKIRGNYKSDSKTCDKLNERRRQQRVRRRETPSFSLFSSHVVCTFHPKPHTHTHFVCKYFFLSLFRSPWVKWVVWGGESTRIFNRLYSLSLSRVFVSLDLRML